MAHFFLKTKFIGILRKLERYTKTDMVYLARGGFWSLFNQGIGSICSFVVVVLLANMLTKESFGQYRFILSIISILTIFTLPGFATAIMRAVARGEGVHLQGLVKTKIRWGFLGSVATLALGVYYLSHGNHQLFSAMLVTALCLPFIEAFFIYTSYYKGKQDFKKSALYESLSRIFQAVVIVAVALITKNVIALVAAFLVGQIVARLFFYLKTVRDVKLSATLEDATPDQYHEIVQYGKHLSVLVVFMTITGNIDKLLVGHFLGVENLAIYSVALTIPRNIVLVSNIIPRIAFPKFSTNSWTAEERVKVLRKLAVLFVALIVPALVYALCVPVVIPIIFKNYSLSIAPALILAFLIPISPVNAMVSQILQSRKSVKQIFALQIVGTLLFVGIFLPLYKTYGATGAAIAVVVGEAATLLLGLIFTKGRVVVK